MPPKSSTAPPSSRRSARLKGTSGGSAEQAAQAPAPAQSKKREATDEPKSTAKKTKADSKTEDSKETKQTNGTKSKSNPAPAPAPAPAPTSKSAKEEKKAEAPASAKSSGKTLGMGDKLPKIKLEDQEGAEVDVSTLVSDDTGIVIFLYPKADTPGCTSQACGFRDHFDQIKELGYQVYGLSKDKPAAQKKWKTKKELNYSLLCDPESKLIKRLGAFVQPNNTKRSHFIFEKKSGKLVDIALGVKPADDPKNCLNFIKKHHS